MTTICPYCQHERSERDDNTISPLICPNCRMPYVNKQTDPEVMDRVKRQLTGNIKKTKPIKVKTKSVIEEDEKFKDEFRKKLKNLIEKSIYVIVFMWVLIYSVNYKNAPKEFTWNDALYMCQQTIGYVSKDPEKADIPYVPDFGTDKEYYFAWGRSTKFARLRNGFGMEIPATASCIVDKAAKKITTLTIDGQTIISSP